VHAPRPTVVSVDPRGLSRGPEVVDVYAVLASRYRWAHSVVLGVDGDEDEVLVGEIVPDPPAR
jgi:hypothetical protein